MAASLLPYAPITFNPECELFYEGGKDSKDLFKDCKINPGHERFIPVPEFTMEHIPPEWRTEEMMDCVRRHCDLTVKIIVPHTSKNRPNTYPDSRHPYPYGHLKYGGFVVRSGTGEICSLSAAEPIEGEPCPCHLCKKKSNPKMRYWSFGICTATHVIYDDEEAAESIFELDYDSEERQNIKKMYGVRVLQPNNDKVRTYTDKCVVQGVTHDIELGYKFLDIFDTAAKKKERKPEDETKAGSSAEEEEIRQDFGLMVSHPHGRSKRITIGKPLFYTVPTGPKLPTGTPHRLGFKVICRFPLFPWSVDKKQIAASFSSEINDLSKEAQEFSHSEISINPGTETTLPSGITYTLPSGTAQAYTYRRDTQDRAWVIFARGTSFTTQDGQRVPFPPEAEFCALNEQEFTEMFIQKKYYFLTYDIDSCPGSSGACVTRHSKEFFQRIIQHSGSLRVDKKLSGMNIYISIPAVRDNLECKRGEEGRDKP